MRSGETILIFWCTSCFPRGSASISRSVGYHYTIIYPCDIVSRKNHKISQRIKEEQEDEEEEKEKEKEKKDDAGLAF